MAINERANVDVDLNGEPAGRGLELLEKKASSLRKQIVELSKQEIIDPKKIKDLEKDLKKTNAEINTLKKTTFDYKKTLDNLSGASIRDLNKLHSQLNFEVKSLARNTDEYKKKAGDLSRVKAEISKVKSEMSAAGVQTKQFNLSLSDIGRNILAATGIVGAFASLAGVVRSAFNTIKEFGTKVSELQAITGASGNDLDYLKNKAKDMAAQYGKSASEIVEAMKMVGSAKPELLENVEALGQMTDAVLVLSKASGMDLAKTTESLATIMNQFGHSAEQAVDDINILAAGSKYGSVEVDYLAQSISKVGTIANAAGLSLEATTAVMELFGEKGVRAETAGTGFKKVLTELQKDTNNYTNGIFDLNKAIDNNQSIASNNLKLQEKFGTEFFGLAQILFQNKERFRELNEQVTGTNVAFEQASIAMDNLSGDIDKAKGAWEKLVLSVEDGDGAISAVLRGIVGAFTSLLGTLEKINNRETSTRERFEGWAKVLAFINPVMAVLNDQLAKVWGWMEKIFGSQQSSTEKWVDATRKKIDELKKSNDEALKRINNATEQTTNKNIELTDKEKEARKKAYEAMVKDSQSLLEQIEQMNVALIYDARTRDTRELELWRNKEQKKIEQSKASATIKNDAMLALEETYQAKLWGIEEKYLEIDYKNQVALAEAEKKRKADSEKAEEEHAGKIKQIREQYGLVTSEEKLENDLVLLKTAFDNKLLTEEEYEIARAALLKKYNDEIKQDSEDAEKEIFKKRKEFLEKAQSIIGITADFFASAKEAELAAAGDNEEAKKEIMKKYADKEFAVKAAQIVASTAQAIMAALAQLGPIAGPIAAVGIGSTGLIQLVTANTERARIKGLASGGRFGVTRAQDGKRFNAVYGGSGFGYYSEPTVLVAEEGPEFVVSNKSLRVPSIRRVVEYIDKFQKGQDKFLNYNRFLNGNAVKGLASGGFTDNQITIDRADLSADSMQVLINEFRGFKNEISSWQKSLEVYVTLQSIREAEKTLSTVETDVRM